jgi:hypothetical protein
VPDVSSNARAATTWVALDVHKNAITAAVLPREGGQPELVQLENSERAIRRLLRRLGGGRGLAVLRLASLSARSAGGRSCAQPPWEHTGGRRSVLSARSVRPRTPQPGNQQQHRPQGRHVRSVGDTQDRSRENCSREDRIG